MPRPKYKALWEAEQHARQSAEEKAETFRREYTKQARLLAELWDTHLSQSLLGVSSTLGRFDFACFEAALRANLRYTEDVEELNRVALLTWRGQPVLCDPIQFTALRPVGG
jgi:hypothetical protein